LQPRNRGGGFPRNCTSSTAFDSRFISYLPWGGEPLHKPVRPANCLGIARRYSFPSAVGGVVIIGGSCSAIFNQPARSLRGRSRRTFAARSSPFLSRSARRPEVVRSRMTVPSLLSNEAALTVDDTPSKAQVSSSRHRPRSRHRERLPACVGRRPAVKERARLSKGLLGELVGDGPFAATRSDAGHGR
jgi:hypothetical protein